MICAVRAIPAGSSWDSVVDPTVVDAVHWPTFQFCAIPDATRRILLVRVLPPHSHRRNGPFVGSPAYRSYLFCHCLWHAHASRLFRLVGGSGRRRVGIRSVYRLFGRSGLREMRSLHRDKYRDISRPTPRAIGKRIGRLSRFHWIRPSSAESKIYPKGWASVDHRSSPRHAPYWCVRSTLTVQKPCSTSQ